MAHARVHPEQDVLPLSQFRANAAGLIRRARENRRPLVLTQRGRGSAVVLDAAEYGRLIEEIETLRDIRAAQKQLAAGRGLTPAAARRKVISQLA